MSNLQRLHYQPQTAESAQAHISFDQKVVETLPLRTMNEDHQIRRFRPISPVKALSSFLSGSGKDLSTPTKPRSGGPLDAPVMLPPERKPSRSNSHRRASDEVNSKVTLVGTGITDTKDSLAHLEATFNSYIVSLRSRSGNVVGKVLRSRAGADELLVNELYNTLLEDPPKLQVAAEVSVDVLFAAFEKYLSKAWKERMGPVLSAQGLKNMQLVLDSSRNGQTTERFRNLLTDMTPQNRRAFTAMIKLLSDLLEASGNDGDRGVLIATFAEALVVEGNPHGYVTLLDHLVEDFDTLFDDSSIFSTHVFSPTSESLQRTRSINTGSLSSNASSVRKRFGFGALSRENSKTDSESRVGHVWRTLSKKSSTEGESQHSSLSKAFLSRSRSTDNDNRRALPSRPTSQDRPNLPLLSPEESRSRPGSGHNTLSNLTTIGEAGSETFQPSLKKKRRSSLSDLVSFQSSGITTFNPPGHLRQIKPPEDSVKPFQTARAALRTPSPTKTKIPGSPNGSPSRFGSPNRKEDSPLVPRNTLTERAVNRKSDEVVIDSFSRKKRDNIQSGIPALKRGLHERADTAKSPSLSNPSLSPTKITKPPQKLRIQSPQKVCPIRFPSAKVS